MLDHAGQGLRQGPLSISGIHENYAMTEFSSDAENDELNAHIVTSGRVKSFEAGARIEYLAYSWCVRGKAVAISSAADPRVRRQKKSAERSAAPHNNTDTLYILRSK